ncbi:Armadillo-like helical-containing protein [Dioscorea alata]|uniref:Armadillo-like helical-containing protein n=1 Tax=Dioscorea alata TaxID=55571 RepID=A0ACB7VKA6_DIOAL|nr:Armadillo-like helical-containing protein [Dioscorea alata]
MIMREKGLYRVMIMNEVVNNCHRLSRDAYGNFIVQHALVIKSAETIAPNCC